MFIAFLVILVLAVLVVVGLAASKPAAFTVQRTLEIGAPPEAIMAELEDFRRWAAWSPWEKMDPAMTKSFSGPAKGVGSSYEWEGKGKVGKGRMTIREVDPGKRMKLDLEFIKPFAANNETVFDLIPEGGVTKVSWAMHGKSPFIFRVMGLFMNMDARIGKDFEHGLKQLKAVTQKG